MIFYYFILFFILFNLIIYLNHNKLSLLGIPFDNPDKTRKIISLRCGCLEILLLIVKDCG